MSLGKTNFPTIPNDANLTAGNIKSGVIISGVTGTFPNDGNAGAGDVLSGKTFYSSDATKQTGAIVLDGNASEGDVANGKTFFKDSTTKKTGTYVAPVGLDKLYVTSMSSPQVWQGSGTHNQQASFALNVSGKIYVPCVWILNVDPYNTNTFLNIIVLTDDFSAFPLQTANHIWPEVGATLYSTRYNSGALYFNVGGSSYCRYTIATDTWTDFTFGGYYTSGTLIATAYTLNGYKFEPSGYPAGPDYGGRYIPLVKITKV